MDNSYKTHLWHGVDKSAIDKIASARSGSAFLAKAIQSFFKVLGPDGLTDPKEGDLPKQARAYNVNLPPWARSYMERLPRGYQTRLVRAAVWFYIGRLSNKIDVDKLFAKLMELASKGEVPEVLTDQQKNDIMNFVDQF